MDKAPEQLCSISINNGFKTVTGHLGASVMATLGRSGIFLPSACGGNARCGYCRIQVTSGNTPLTPAEVPLISEANAAAGFRLACQFKLTSDIAVSIPQNLFSVKRFSGKVADKSMLTYDIMRLTIELTPPQTISFTAGQYVQLKSMPYDGHDAVLREFSIASPPSMSNKIDLMIRKTPNGIFTPWAFDRLNVGDSISLSGPYGDFCISNTNAPMLMIAGGSGMAPLYSMLQHMRINKINRPVHYFFGALTKKDLFLTDELYTLEKDLPQFKFYPALSCEPDTSCWNGDCGLITDVVKRHIPDCTGFEAYLCGSPGMINACIKVLTESGIGEDRIFYDKF